MVKMFDHEKVGQRWGKNTYNAGVKKKLFPTSSCLLYGGQMKKKILMYRGNLA